MPFNKVIVKATHRNKLKTIRRTAWQILLNVGFCKFSLSILFILFKFKVQLIHQWVISNNSSWEVKEIFISQARSFVEWDWTVVVVHESLLILFNHIKALHSLLRDRCDIWCSWQVHFNNESTYKVSCINLYTKWW